VSSSLASAMLTAAKYHLLNRVVLNQVLLRCETDEGTKRVTKAAQESGEVWFGPTVWQGRPAFRLSFSSWRTTDHDVDRLCALLANLNS
jgi:hypothetical protein